MRVVGSFWRGDDGGGFRSPFDGRLWPVSMIEFDILIVAVNDEQWMNDGASGIVPAAGRWQICLL